MPGVKNDGILKIAIGSSRFETKWKNKKLSWSEFLDRILVTTRTRETLAEYGKMNKKQQDQIKDVGGFVGGIVKDGRRTIGSVDERMMLTLDADFAPGGFDTAFEIDMNLGCAAAWYSTHKHTPDKPRLRIVIPLTRPVSAEEYQALGRKVADAIGIDFFDDTTYQPHRLMYWPSTAADGEFLGDYIDGNWMNPDEWLGQYSNWKDVSEWPVSSRQAHAVKKMADKQGDPTEKPGIVGAFCRAYDVTDVIDKHLSDLYADAGNGRYSYAMGSTSSGVIVYEDGKFLYSHHATDPISGQLVNAFDLLRIHKFHELDAEAGISEETPINKRPSYSAMCTLATTDPVVKRIIADERIESAADDFAEDGAEEDWTEKLHINSRGGFVSNAQNVLLILKHDTAIKGKFKIDEFAHRAVVSDDLPWREIERGRLWNDTDDSGLRNYLSNRYMIKGQGIIMDAWREVISGASYHPVKEYLDSLVWDETSRIDTIMIDYLGASDSPYTRAVTRKALVAAVARIYRPGIKYDTVLTLIGEQGQGKSYILKRLGRDWFSDSLTTVQGKEAYEQLQGSWIMELAELSATKKAEADAIKHFITKQVDIFRAPYDKHTSEYPRQCVFFGTTNDREFLKDKTGNRRFWPVPVGVLSPARNLFKDFTDEEVDQVWAEAVALFKAGEELHLDREMEAVANEIRDQHTEEDPYVGIISEYLETKLPENWTTMEAFERMNYFSSAEKEGKVKREFTCVIEIWCECFRGTKNNLTPQVRRNIANALKKVPGWQPWGDHKKTKWFRDFGNQKAYFRE